jgi:hypothetical protein
MAPPSATFSLNLATFHPYYKIPYGHCSPAKMKQIGLLADS